MKAPYFAVDKFEPTALAKAFLSVVENTNGNGRWYALLDSSFDYEARKVGWKGVTPVPVYFQGRFEPLGEAGPILYPLSIAVNELEQEAKRLLRRCSGRPMISFLYAELSPETLRQSWQSLLEVETEDGQSFLLRFADTRVLPVLAELTAIWEPLAAGIKEWWSIGRKGEWQMLKLPSGFSQSKEAIRLSDADLAYLLEKGEPDAIVRALDEFFPEYLLEGQNATIFERLLQLSAIGNAHGLTGSSQFFALAVADFSSGNRLVEHPEFAEWLKQKSWSATDFEDALGVFVEEHFGVTNP